MDIKEYFNEVQNFVKANIEHQDDIDSIIKELEKDNIQAVVNQDYNDGVSIEDCADKLLKSMNIQGGIDMNEPNQMAGDRGANTMERKVMKYSDFVNERSNFPISLTQEEKDFLNDKFGMNSTIDTETLSDEEYVISSSLEGKGFLKQVGNTEIFRLTDKANNYLDY